MYWEIAPGYRFELSFDLEHKDGNPTLEFREAGFSAQNKSGFPPQEYHTVYPYRTWRGMINE